MTDEFSNSVSLVSNIDEVALIATEAQGKSEFCMPSGPVGEAEVPPVTETGVYRSRYNRAWYQVVDEEMQELAESKTFTV